MVRGIFDGVPLWAILLGTVLVFVLSAEAGYRAGAAAHRRSGKSTLADLGTTLGGLLGLLGLLLAFTFSMAGERFDARKTMVVEEANAIGTAWLRTDLVPEPARTRARDALRAYTQLRLDAAASGWHGLGAAISRSEQIHADLWRAAADAAAAAPTPTVALFVASVNEVIDMHGRRIAAGVRNPIPPVILGTLYAVAVLTLATFGLSRGISGDRSSLTTTILSVVLAVVLALIVDLDRPAEGFLRVGQQAMQDVRASMGP